VKAPSLALVGLLLFGCQRNTQTVHTELDLGPAAAPAAKRIVTLAPSLTELIVAMGGTDRIVGVTRFDDSPAVAQLPRVGGYSDPDPEAVLRVKPDLILCQPSPGNRSAVEQLARSGIPVVALSLSTLAELETATARVGELLGMKRQAQAEIDRVRAARSAAQAAARKRGRKLSVAIFVQISPLIAAGPGSFSHEMLEDAGAEDAVPASVQPYPKVAIETFIRKKPDAFLLALMPGENEGVQPVPGITVPTVRLKSQGFMRPGPTVVEALEELTRTLDGLASKH
jgi:iron complex transport system substrate-binding protein